MKISTPIMWKVSSKFSQFIRILLAVGKCSDGGGNSSRRTGQVARANQQQSNVLNLQQLRRNRAIAVDRISRTGFPLSFCILNVIYWCVFLNSEDVTSVG